MGSLIWYDWAGRHFPLTSVNDLVSGIWHLVSYSCKQGSQLIPKKIKQQIVVAEYDYEPGG